MDECRRPLPSAADASMESWKRSSASECVSRDSPSTAAQPAPRLQLLPQKRARVDETICDVGDARSGVDGDIEEWVEVNEGYEEVNEADEYGRDDDMSDPSLGLGDKENDVEGEVNDTEKGKRGKRNKAKVDVGNKVKVRKTRVMCASCWQHFQEVKVVCKKKPGAIVTKAKCLHYCNLFAYTPGGTTTSLNRHTNVCVDYLNKKGRQQRQGGRVLDDYRSSLCPSTVEALVCASSCIKGSKENHIKPTIIVEDDIDDDVEFIPFPESMVMVESN